MRIVTVKEIIKPNKVNDSISELVEEFEEYELLNVKYETRNYELLVEFKYETPAFQIGDVVKLNAKGRKGARLYNRKVSQIDSLIVTDVLLQQVKVEGHEYYMPKKWLMHDKEGE